MSVRSQKVASEVRKALSPVMDEFARSNGGGLLTITNVIMSPDLSIAKVYFSVFGSRTPHDDLLKSLALDAFRFKRALVSHMRLRIVPEIRFYVDTSLDQVEKITQILHSNPPMYHEPQSDERNEHPESGDAQ